MAACIEGVSQNTFPRRAELALDVSWLSNASKQD